MNMERRPAFKLGEMTEEDRQKAMLDTVLKEAANDEARIDNGIAVALKGVHDRARRTYLWNELKRKAKAKIRRDQKKGSGN